MTDIAGLPLARWLRGVRVAGEGAPASRRLLELRSAQTIASAQQEAVAACAEAVRQALASLPASVGERLDRVAELATEIGLAVAAEAVGAALPRQLIDPLPVVRRCLGAAVAGGGSDGPALRLRLPPDAAAVLADADELRQVEVVADASLAPGAAAVDCGAGELLYDPREVVVRLCDELRRELAGGGDPQ